MTHSSKPAESGETYSDDDRRRVALVTTTIRMPKFLAEVLENADRYGHLPRVSVVVVGDRKTPGDVGTFLQALARQHAVDVTFLDIPRQKSLLRRWPSLDLFLRYDNIQRRNVGYLQAALNEAEVIITVDDDNFVTEADFIGGHTIVGRRLNLPVVSHPSGWWNVCERLQATPPRRFYPRGFPKSLQNWSTGGETVARQTVRVIANGGLWLGAPDVDATAHIEEPIQVTAMEPLGGSPTCALAPGTWCPLNSQNTAFDASTLPAMYLPVMHDRIRGQRINHMDDIWMGYFLRAIADRRSELVTYGSPLVVQQRNPHHVLGDLAEEIPGYFLTEHLVGYLRRFQPTAESYSDSYLELIYHLRESAEDDSRLDVPEREYLRTVTLGMAAWHAAVREILAG